MGRRRGNPTLRRQARIILTFVVLIWIIALINALTGYQLNRFGIHPRRVTGLPGILLAPLLHANFTHLMLNTLPFIVLAWLIMVRDENDFIEVSGFIVIVGGLGVWIFGRSHLHLGASGMTFGYFGYLLARAWYERGFLSVLTALITILAYGSIFFSVLPLNRAISWESHLFGLLAGVLAARVLYDTKLLKKK